MAEDNLTRKIETGYACIYYNRNQFKVIFNDGKEIIDNYCDKYLSKKHLCYIFSSNIKQIKTYIFTNDLFVVENQLLSNNTIETDEYIALFSKDNIINEDNEYRGHNLYLLNHNIVVNCADFDLKKEITFEGVIKEAYNQYNAGFIEVFRILLPYPDIN